MFSIPQESEKFVIDNYGLDLDFETDETIVIADGETVIENGIARHLDTKGGTYTYYDLKSKDGIYYKLLYFPAGDENKEKFIQNAKDEEMRDISGWEYIAPKRENKNYVLYKILPIMIQGIPHYHT